MKSHLSDFFTKFNIEEFRIASFNGLIFYFDGDDLNTKNKNVSLFFEALQINGFSWLKEAIPSYNSCLIEYDAFTHDHHQVLFELATLKIVTPQPKQKAISGKLHKIPVWYCDSHPASDLTLVASAKGMTINDVIKIHTEQEYRVYAVGFQPGFAYLGELDQSLSMPRLKTPRICVPSGSVAIADRQTSIYPNSSPGGWNILGLCPLNLTQKAMSNAAFGIGDKVVFYAINSKEYEKLSEPVTSMAMGINK